MSEHDLGERMAALEVEVKNTNRKLDDNLEQLRKMHQQHYDEAKSIRSGISNFEKKNGEQMVEVFGIAKDSRDTVKGHIENHWKWFTWVVGTVLAVMSLAIAYFKK